MGFFLPGRCCEVVLCLLKKEENEWTKEFVMNNQNILYFLLSIYVYELIIIIISEMRSVWINGFLFTIYFGFWLKCLKINIWYEFWNTYYFFYLNDAHFLIISSLFWFVANLLSDGILHFRIIVIYEFV
jgi:hypothetical protein